MPNKTSIIAAVVGGALLLGGGIAIGQWIEKPALDQLVERNQMLERRDSVRVVELEEGRVAYERLVADYNDLDETKRFVEDSLNNVANALLRDAERNERQIETLAQTVVSLQDSLSGDLSNVTVSDSMVTAELYVSNTYNDGEIMAEGEVTVFIDEDFEPWGRTSLLFNVDLKPAVLISRDENGLAQCDVSFGDMPVYVREMRCINNFDVDMPTRSPLDVTLGGVAVGGALMLGGLAILSLIF